MFNCGHVNLKCILNSDLLFTMFVDVKIGELHLSALTFFVVFFKKTILIDAKGIPNFPIAKSLFIKI